MRNVNISRILACVDEAVICLLETKPNLPDGMKRVEFRVEKYRVLAYRMGTIEDRDGGIKIEVTEKS